MNTFKKFMQVTLLTTLLIQIFSCSENASFDIRQSFLLDADWKFINEEVANAYESELDDSKWVIVEIPHDWAISGEFNVSNDAYSIKVIEDGDTKEQLRTGYTGGLPHVGIGWYRKNLDIPEANIGNRIHLEFDGVMSNSKVYINGNYVGEWPFGYASFGFDITDYVKFGGENILAVRAENKEHSSRWYPGAGIYRNVRMIITNPVYVKQ
jgi:beta-galactosidase